MTNRESVPFSSQAVFSVSYNQVRSVFGYKVSRSGGQYISIDNSYCVLNLKSKLGLGNGTLASKIFGLRMLSLYQLVYILKSYLVALLGDVEIKGSYQVFALS